MIIDASGPWNMEYFTQLHLSLNEAAKNINIKHYGVLLRLSGQAIAVEGGLEIHSKFVSKSNVKAMALDFSCCESSPISKKLFTKAYNLANIHFEIFDNGDDAKEWLVDALSP